MKNTGKHLAVAALLAMAGLSAQAANSPITVSLTPAKAVLQANEDVLVNVTITNTGATDQTVLKWHTPFNDEIEGLFDVVRDGVKVAFNGPHYKRGAPTAADYVLLKAGKSYSYKVELSALFDMSVRGNYSIRYRSGSINLLGGANGNGFAPGAAQVVELKSGSVSMWINGSNKSTTAKAPTLAQSLVGSLSFNGCTASQSSDITTAVANAKTYASGALGYMNAGTAGLRYSTWFGTNDAGRFANVTAHYSAILDAFNNQPVTVDCKCKKTYYAYVFPNQPYTIYVCKAFWTAPATGTDSKAGTLIHEMSHFNVTAGTDDWAYGQTAARSLAISDPAKATDNADSHEYFAENTPAQN
jgi:peptidyl-Lys metalloendopeptidase